MAIAFILHGCQKTPLQEPKAAQATVLNQDASLISYNMVLTWNEAATVAVERLGGLPPQPESRIYAIVNIAMHNALNTIQQRYNRFAFEAAIVNNGSPDAAVAQAAHDAIVGLMPPVQVHADSLLQVSLNAIPNGIRKTNISYT